MQSIGLANRRIRNARNSSIFSGVLRIFYSVAGRCGLNHSLHCRLEIMSLQTVFGAYGGKGEVTKDASAAGSH